MCAPRRFVSLLPLSLAAAFASITAAPAFAAGPGDGPASPKPKPSVEKKVYTNDDLDALAAKYGGPARRNTSSANAAPQRAPQPSAASSRPAILPNDQNPVWYAQQVVSMQSQLASIDTQIADLSEYRASQSTAAPGVSTGFGLYGPFGGITTYNRIDQLARQRQEIEAQMNALADTASSNGFSPGLLRDSDRILQAAESRVVVSPQERQAALAKQEKAYSAQLGQVQETLGSIDQQAAAQNITLNPVRPGFGGSITTNNIQDLDNQARDLRQKITEIQDESRATAP
jgi:hypothetical protein